MTAGNASGIVDGWLAAYVAACAHTVGALPFAQVRTGRVLAAVVGLGAAAYAWLRWRTPSSRPT